jgi:hypothetical protein
MVLENGEEGESDEEELVLVLALALVLVDSCRRELSRKYKQQVMSNTRENCKTNNGNERDKEGNK